MLNILGGMEPNTSGDVIVAGKNIAKYNAKELRAIMSIIPFQILPVASLLKIENSSLNYPPQPFVPHGAALRTPALRGSGGGGAGAPIRAAGPPPPHRTSTALGRGGMG